MQKIFFIRMKWVCLFLGCLITTATYAAECNYYKAKTIDAANQTQVAILEGRLYSNTTILGQPGNKTSQRFSLKLVPISSDEWEKASKGQQVSLTGQATCNCTVTGRAESEATSPLPYPIGHSITPFQLTDLELSPLSCQ
jgi:hypothetical protein